jgi:hypothetical protein
MSSWENICLYYEKPENNQKVNKPFGSQRIVLANHSEIKKGGDEVAQIMYTHVSKCKIDKIK